MMTFTSEQLATLRKIAQQATQGEWRAFISPDTGTYAVHTPGDERCGDIIKWPGFDGQKNAENNAEFIAAFNPKLVQTLLDERERNQQYIKRRDQENEEIALTVGKLRVELEETKSKLNEQREYYEGVISDGSNRIAELESNRATLAAEHGIQIAINELASLSPQLDKRAVETLSMAVAHLRKLVKKQLQAKE
ncbi:hypothetical protein HMPREF9533_01617 [Escherichia coli MS 60-1]|mgnify:CR=1 FL=1|nr:hypothetical protein HMPREF9533_01617 [Escherichia coli MS 60-1]